MNSCSHTWAIAYGGNGRWVYDPLDNLREIDQGARQFRCFYDDRGTGADWRLDTIRSPGGTRLHEFAYDVRGTTLQRKTGESGTIEGRTRHEKAALGKEEHRQVILGSTLR